MLGSGRRPLVGAVVLLLVIPGCSSTRGNQPVVTTTSEAPGPTGTPTKTKAPSAEKAVAQTFDEDPTGQGAPVWAPILGEWTVKEDSSAPTPPNVYAQVGDSNIRPPAGAAGQLFGSDYAKYLDNITAYEVFPSTVLTDHTYQDLEASVSYKPVSGQVDQTGGLIFRAKGPADYYIWRCNVLEGDCRLWTYVAGQRNDVYEVVVSGQNTGEWQSIKVIAKGDHIQGFYGDRMVMDIHDSTFSDAGTVGLWTKADAITEFDDFTVKPL